MAFERLKNYVSAVGERREIRKIDKMHENIMKLNPVQEEWRVHPNLVLLAQRELNEISSTASKNRSLVVWDHALKTLKNVSREFRNPDVRRSASEYHSSLNSRYRSLFGSSKSFKGVFKN